MNFSVHKLISIPTIIISGLLIAAIPHIAADLALNDREKVNKDIYYGLFSCNFIYLAVIAFMFVFSKETYYVMYGITNADLASGIFRLALIKAIVNMFASLSLNLMLVANMRLKANIVYIFIFFANVIFMPIFVSNGGYVAKYVYDILSMCTFTGIYAYMLKKQYDYLDYKQILNTLGKQFICLIPGVLVSFALYVLTQRFMLSGRIITFVLVIGESLIGGLVYIYASNKLGLIKDIFGVENLSLVGLVKQLLHRNK